MATKNNPGEFDCYAAVADDEPIFILRATDRLAPEIVEAWADRYALSKVVAQLSGAPAALTIEQRRKYDEAKRCAREMRRWRDHKPACPNCGSVHVEGTNCKSCGFSAT